MTPGERFAHEPPLFGDGASSGSPPNVFPSSQPGAQPRPTGNIPSQQHPPSRPHVALPPPPFGSQPPQIVPPQPARTETPPVPRQQPTENAPPPTNTEETPTRAGSAPSPNTPDSPTDTSPERESAPIPDKRTFTPVSDIIEQADAEKLDWLGHVSAGRRIRLQRLGYDVPEKLANLRRSEIRRLSRELSVSEEVIRNEWVPAAEAFLRDRQS